MPDLVGIGLRGPARPLHLWASRIHCGMVTTVKGHSLRTEHVLGVARGLLNRGTPGRLSDPNRLAVSLLRQEDS